ncbi:hypothetical protein HB904_04115 [Listeria booriae]|uniref:Uncharacterized protein n=1 Tax=Listeria booriae TaxID=1552123 RepID=A0A842AH08_9LIST|nr:hypothetical protein [Listeria booriae]MBC1615358.1 hypothetical protein [Listeria booriae]
MEGWIKLHRSIVESDTYNCLSLHQKVIMIEILLRANHADNFWFDKRRGEKVEVLRGQLITSVHAIENEWFSGDKEVTTKKVRTTLDKLKKLDFLAIETTNSYTRLTICKYNDYQLSDVENGKQDDKQMANEGQTEGKPRATNKNVKNVKKKKTPQKIEFSEEHLQLAYYFFDRILENLPEKKPPNFEKWANTIRLMMNDGRTNQQIKWLMTWVQQNDFEMANVLSPTKLRERFDSLALKAKKERTKKLDANTSKQEATRRLLEEGEDL